MNNKRIGREMVANAERLQQIPQSQHCPNHIAKKLATLILVPKPT
jgi:hypothetical protein